MTLPSIKFSPMRRSCSNPQFLYRFILGGLVGGLGAIATTPRSPAWSLTPPNPIHPETPACPAATATPPRASEPHGEAPGNITSSHATPSNTNPTNAIPDLSNDYALFARAVQNIYAQPRYLTISTAKLHYEHQGQPLTSQLRSNITTAATLGSYRAELSLENDDGLSSQQFLVISDGLQTWILDRSRNQYSVTPNRQQGPFTDNSLGLLAPFVLAMQQLAVPELPQLASMDEEKLAEQLKVVIKETPDLTLSSTQVDGQPYQQIQIGNAELGTVGVWVDPQSAQVRCAELSLGLRGAKANIQETILSREALPELEADQFRFIPPEGSVEVKQPIRIGAF